MNGVVYSANTSTIYLYEIGILPQDDVIIYEYLLTRWKLHAASVKTVKKQ